MLEVIEVQIDVNGTIHPIKPTMSLPQGRALLIPIEDKKESSELATKNVFEDLFGILTASRGATLEDLKRS